MKSQLSEKQTDRGWNCRKTVLVAVFFLFTGLLTGFSAGADEPGANLDPMSDPAEFQGEFGLDALDGFSVAGESELAESRGGESTAISLQDMQSTVEGNVVSGNVTTGSVNIGENAFTDFDGISSVVINSGNNVSIQSSTVVNVIIGD